jgi:hypothetical protein
MDIRKIKKLIELLEESSLAESEISPQSGVRPIASPSRILKTRLVMPRVPACLIGLEGRLGVEPQRLTDLKHGPKLFSH